MSQEEVQTRSLDQAQAAGSALDGATDLVWANRDFVEEVRAHNCGVIVRRRRGEDWTAPQNQYRNALAELGWGQ